MVGQFLCTSVLERKARRQWERERQRERRVTQNSEQWQARLQQDQEYHRQHQLRVAGIPEEREARHQQERECQQERRAAENQEQRHARLQQDREYMNTYDRQSLYNAAYNPACHFCLSGHMMLNQAHAP